MIYLIWSLLNLFLILSFLYFAIGLIVKGRKFLEPYFKPFVLFVLIFGTYGFVKFGSKKLQEEVKVNPNPSTQEVITVSEQLTNTLSLILIKDKDTGEIDQEYSKSYIHGLVLGLKWNHVEVAEKDGKIEVEGWWDLNLIGNRVFSHYETYQIGDNYPEVD